MPLPYVKRLYSAMPCWPSRVTEKVVPSFDGETTLDDLVFSGHILDKGPLRVTHLSIAYPRPRTIHENVSFALMSFRSMCIGLCCHLIIQSDTVSFHTQVVERHVPPARSPMLDRCSQGRVRTKSGSSHNCQFTPVVILWSGAGYELWEDQIFL